MMYRTLQTPLRGKSVISLLIIGCAIMSAVAIFFFGGNGTIFDNAFGIQVVHAAVLPVVDGQCGGADGGWFNSEPAGAALCDSGVPTAVTFTGSGWTWTCQGSGGGTEDRPVSGDGVNGVPLPPVVDRFEGVPPTINDGESTTLEWDVSGAATSCAIRDLPPYNVSYGVNNPGSPGGSLPIASLNGVGNHTFEIICSNAGGDSAPRQTTVIVNPPAPTVAISANGANPLTVNEGTNITIGWTIGGGPATNCTASGDWSGSKATGAGPHNESIGAPSSGTYTYTIDCSGPGGLDSDSVDVTVNPNAPTVNFSVSSPITNGNISTLTWDSTYTTSCTATVGSWSGGLGPRGVDGTEPSNNLTQDTPFTIRCDGPGGNVIVPRTVGVLPGITSFSATQPQIPSGANVTIDWGLVRGSGVTCQGITIGDDGGAVGTWAGPGKNFNGGSTLIGPITQDSTYRLVCSNVHGPDAAEDSVQIFTPQVNVSSPLQKVLKGKTTKISVEATGVESCLLKEDTNITDGIPGNIVDSFAADDPPGYGDWNPPLPHITPPVFSDIRYDLECQVLDGLPPTDTIIITPFVPAFDEE